MVYTIKEAALSVEEKPLPDFFSRYVTEEHSLGYQSVDFSYNSPPKLSSDSQ